MKYIYMVLLGLFLYGCGYATADGPLRCVVWGDSCIPEAGADGTNGIDGADGTDGAAGTNGSNGTNGANGRDGSSCSVESVQGGALIKCDDATVAIVLNGTNGADGAAGADGADGADGSNGTDGADGTNGTNAPPTAYTVTEIVDPCGDHPGSFDEVLFRLANNTLVAHFASGSLQFLTILTPGTYRTTDAQSCRFTVGADLSISYP